MKIYLKTSILGSKFDIKFDIFMSVRNVLSKNATHRKILFKKMTYV